MPERISRDILQGKLFLNKMDSEEIQITTLKATVEWLVAKIDTLLEKLEKTKNPATVKKMQIEIVSLHKKCVYELREIDKIIKRIDDNDYER